MIKRIVLLVTIFILGLSTPTLAAEPGSGSIEGQIVNGTAGGSSVANQDVTLKIHQGDTEVGSTTTQTNTEGQFVFDGLSTKPDYSYEVMVNFQEAEYYSDWLNFDEAETTKSTEVIVYDSTTSDEAIKILMAHTIIYVEPGTLLVKEYFAFANKSDRTYIGPTTEGTTGTLRFFLPADVTERQYTLGLMECCIVGNEEGFVDTMPVIPGSKEVAYSYKVDYTSAAYTFSQMINYPTTKFDLLVQGEDIEVTSDQLIIGEPMDIGGTAFNHLLGSDFAPGDILVTQVSGLPNANNQGTIMWAGLVLVVLVFGLSFGYVLRKKRLQPVRPEDSLDRSKQRLLVELAQLDDDFEGGKIPEEVYRRRRAERKAQLVKLMQGAKELVAIDNGET